MRATVKALIVAVFIMPVYAISEPPTCSKTSSGSPYCQYTGKVKRLYINRWNRILLYFEDSISPDIINETGFNVTKYSAGTYYTPDNPDYAEKLYSTLLAAQASGRDVTVQMRDANGGYLIIDRVWLADE